MPLRDPRERPVFYVARTVPAYRVPILERLDERLGGRLIVCAGSPPETSSLASIQTASAHRYREVVLRNLWINGEQLHIQLFGKAFRTSRSPAVVLAEESPRTLSLPFLLRTARLHGSGTVLWGHFSSNDRPFAPKQHLADRYRLWLACQADACACYTDSIRKLLQPYIPDQKLYTAPNTIDIDPLLALHNKLSAEGKENVRERLGIPPATAVLLYLGRLIPEKGLSEVLAVFDLLRRQREAHLIVIGAGPERALIDRYHLEHPYANISILGPINDHRVSAPYIFASDMLLMPAALGLAVNHAFALGVPVVSRRVAGDARHHGPEANYVQSEVTGIMVTELGLDPLYRGVQAILSDQPRYSINALTYAREHLGIERMVDGLEAAILCAANRPEGSSLASAR